MVSILFSPLFTLSISFYAHLTTSGSKDLKIPDGLSPLISGKSEAKRENLGIV